MRPLRVGAKNGPPSAGRRRGFRGEEVERRIGSVATIEQPIGFFLGADRALVSTTARGRVAAPLGSPNDKGRPNSMARFIFYQFIRPNAARAARANQAG